MIPDIRTAEDIETVIQHRGRWRPKQRIIALKRCQKTLYALRLANKIPADRAFAIRRKLLPTLKQEERRYASQQAKVERLADSTEAAANLASLLGIDLNKITGTGKDGRVTLKDVRGYDTANQ